MLTTMCERGREGDTTTTTTYDRRLSHGMGGVCECVCCVDNIGKRGDRRGDNLASTMLMVVLVVLVQGRSSPWCLPLFINFLDDNLVSWWWCVCTHMKPCPEGKAMVWVRVWQGRDRDVIYSHEVRCVLRVVPRQSNDITSVCVLQAQLVMIIKDIIICILLPTLTFLSLSLPLSEAVCVWCLGKEVRANLDTQAH